MNNTNWMGNGCAHHVVRYLCESWMKRTSTVDGLMVMFLCWWWLLMTEWLTRDFFFLRNSDIPLPLQQPCRYYSPKVTDASWDHDASYRDQCSSDVDCDAIAAVAHDYDYYYYCYYCFAAKLDAVNSSCSSCVGFGTKF